MPVKGRAAAFAISGVSDDDHHQQQQPPVTTHDTRNRTSDDGRSCCAWHRQTDRQLEVTSIRSPAHVARLRGCHLSQGHTGMTTTDCQICSKLVRSIAQSHAVILCQLEMSLQGCPSTLLHQSYLSEIWFCCRYLGLLIRPIPEHDAALTPSHSIASLAFGSQRCSSVARFLDFFLNGLEDMSNNITGQILPKSPVAVRPRHRSALAWLIADLENQYCVVSHC